MVCPNCEDFKPITAVRIPSNFKMKIDGAGLPYVETKFGVQIAKQVDKYIYESIMSWAKENGYTDVYLIDEEFIRSAIENEIKRRKESETSKNQK